MKEIIVNSRKHGIKKILVSDKDYKKLMKHTWSVYAGHTTLYSLTSKKKGNLKTTRSMHRMIMNAKKGVAVDHRNHNGLDNRRSNLRLCTDSQNSMNMKKPIHNTSGYKGVCFERRRKKFYAHIKIKDKNTFLGYTKTAIESAIRYNEAAKKHFKEFANLNQL